MAELDDLEPTYPAQALYRVLRGIACVVQQTADDMADEDKRAELQELFSQGPLSDLDRFLITRALNDLARELELRANATWDANVEYLGLVLKDAERRN